jgi:HK97 family phage major capsid protein
MASNIYEGDLSGAAKDAFYPTDIASAFFFQLAKDSVVLRTHRHEQTGLQAITIPTVGTGTDGATWVNEGDSLPESKPDLGGYTVTALKLGTTATVSNEALADSELVPNVITESMSRNMSRAIDHAVFAGVSGSPAPNSIANLSGTTGYTYGTGSSKPDYAKLVDKMNLAIAASAGLGHPLTSFVCNSDLWGQLSIQKEGSNSYLDLFQSDPTQPSQLRVAGVPVVISPDMPDGVLYGLPQSVCYAVIRNNLTVATSQDERFSNDETVIRLTLRFNAGYPDPAPIATFTVS